MHRCRQDAGASTRACGEPFATSVQSLNIRHHTEAENRSCMLPATSQTSANSYLFYGNSIADAQRAAHSTIPYSCTSTFGASPLTSLTRDGPPGTTTRTPADAQLVRPTISSLGGLIIGRRRRFQSVPMSQQSRSNRAAAASTHCCIAWDSHGHLWG
jgi:hypothetical protein